MPKIEAFCKENMKHVRSELQELLDNFAAEKGLRIDLGRITYTESDFKSSIRVIIPTDGAESPMALDFKNKCYKYGFLPEDLGKRFRTGSKDTQYEIVGLKPRNRKYPIIARKVSTGEQYKFAPTTVRLGLGNHPLTRMDF